MKRKLLWLLPVLAAGFFNPATAQDYEHLTITTGLTADVIANGFGSASASTTLAVDNANFAFMAADFQPNSSAVIPAYALPVSGLVNSVPTPGLTYQLAPYSGNNSLRIATANTSGTLVFSNQVSATKLYLLATTGSGTATITGTITFTDNSTQAITSSVIPDWFFSNALPVAYSGFGRVNRLTNVMENPAGDPRLYQLAIDILPANQTKEIASIMFTKTSTAEGILNIFAITAELLGTCPSPGGLTATSTADSGTVTWTPPVVLPAVGYDYYYSTTNTPPTATTTPSGSVAVGTNTFTLPSLITGQQYYVWVRSSCSDTDMGPWVMTTFTTGQATAVYTTGDISTEFNTAPTVTSTTACPGTLSVTIPAGYEVTSVSTAYTMTTDSNGWKSEQRSLLVCTSTGNAETAVTAGVGGTGGTMAYNRTGLDIADGATGTVNFELRAWRTYGGTGCGVTHNMVDDDSWTVTVTYALICTAPDTPTAAAQEVCATSTISGLAATGAAGATFNWYTAATGGTPLLGTATVTAGTYHVSQSLNGCESERTAVIVTTTIVPEPTVDGTQNFCAGTLAAELEAQGETGGTVVWSLTAGGAALSADTPLETGTYYIWQVMDGCTSEINDVAVFIIDVAEPSTNTVQTFCYGATVDNFTAQGAEGTTLQWSATEGGAILDGSTVLETGSYFVRAITDECESEWIEVDVTINSEVQDVLTSATQTVCEGNTIGALYAEGANTGIIKWSQTEGGALLNEDDVLQAGTYYVMQTVGDCDSDWTAVNVIVNPVPNAPLGADIQQFTTGETVGDLVIDTVEGSLVSWFIMSEGGVLVSVNTATALDNNETYYVQQTVGGCESEFLEILALESLSTANFAVKGLKAYPNPVNDVLTITNTTNITDIVVYNLLGQKVARQTANSNNVQVNVSQLAAGTYVLQVTAEDGSQAALKIIKQ